MSSFEWFIFVISPSPSCQCFYITCHARLTSSNLIFHNLVLLQIWKRALLSILKYYSMMSFPLWHFFFFLISFQFEEKNISIIADLCPAVCLCFSAGFSEHPVQVLGAFCPRTDVAQTARSDCIYFWMAFVVAFPGERVTCLHCATWKITVTQPSISLYFPALPARPALPAGRGVLWAWGLCQSPPSLWQKVLDSGTEICLSV